MADGFIFGSVLDGAGSGQSLDAVPSSAADLGGVAWLHLDYRDPAAQSWLQEQSGVEYLAAAALLDEDTRPRVREFATGILINLRGVNLNAGEDAEDMVSVRIWLEPRRIITTRRRQVRSPRELYEALAHGAGPKGPGDFLCLLAARLGEHIETVIDSIEADIDRSELQFVDQLTDTYHGEFGHLRRKTAQLRRYLAPQREALERLSRLESDVLSGGQRQALHEEADTIMRHLEDLDLCRERATVAQEELLNTLAQRQNQRMYVLSIVAAVFLPLSFLTGLLGMNVAGLPGTDDPAAFGLTVAIMVACGVAILALFRWKKWF